jgi:hypothetical protein
MTLPARTLASTPQEHLDDHEALRGAFNNRGLVNVKEYGATGDGVTDDAAAITAAIAALGATAKVLYFPPGVYLDSVNRNFDASSNIVILGDGGRLDRLDTPSTEWRFTGTGSTAFLSARAAKGLTISGIAIRYVSSSFTGDLLDLRSNGGAATYGITLRDCLFGATTSITTAAACVNVNGIVELLADNCCFSRANYLVRVGSGGLGYSNALNFRACRFVDAGSESCNGAGVAQWHFDGCVFEPTPTGAAAPVHFGGGNRLISFVGCGFWDASTGTAAWIKGEASPIAYSIVGCLFDLPDGGVALDLGGANGLSVTGCSFELYPGATAASLFKTPATITGKNVAGNNFGSGVTDNSASV